MLEVVPYEFEEIKNSLKAKALDKFGLTDVAFEGSNISQLINLLAYSQVINNTNLSFGLNEMFINRASDDRNIIEHAHQMGYISKCNVSYQYRIKLKSTVTNLVSLDKYTEFHSGDKNYIYMGEDITEIFGTYCNYKILTNENNNSIKNTDSIIEKEKLFISSNGIVCKVIDKDIVNNSKRVFLDTLNSGPISLYGEKNKVLIYDSQDEETGYRNLKSVGDIEYIQNTEINGIKKINIKIIPNGTQFPVPKTASHESKIIQLSSNQFSMINNTPYTITGIETLYINNNLVKNIDDITLDGTNIFFDEVITNSDQKLDIILENNEIYIFTENIIKSVYSVSLVKNNIEINIELSTTKFSDNILKVPQPQLQEKEFGLTVMNNYIVLKKVPSEIELITLINDTIADDISTIIDGNRIYLINSDGTDYTELDGEIIEVTYKYYQDLYGYSARLKYDNILDVNNKICSLNYEYTRDSYGKLVNNIFFPDFRGETLFNESDYSYSNINGFNGFEVQSYDDENNILSIDGTTKYMGNNLSDILQPNIFTRFSKTSLLPDGTYSSFNDEDIVFSINSVNVKDEIEIIVKEGILKKYYEETDESLKNRELAILNGLTLPEKVLKYPELTFDINDNIINSGYFVMLEEDIEENGLELFITRSYGGVMEVDKLWTKKDQLLLDKTVEERSFLMITNNKYPEYKNIYIKYAGVGDDFDNTYKFKINKLLSSGSAGKIIEGNELTTENEYFEVVPFDDNNYVKLYVEGFDKESIQSIKESAVSFFGTANRAVTKNDYLNISKAQTYIQNAQIWGGEEEVPEKKLGKIFFSLIPQSRENKFIERSGSYYLDHTNDINNYLLDTQILIGDNKESLFNVLKNYKIITLDLINVKPIYIDFDINITISKYKLGSSRSDINFKIFEEIKEFFEKSLETFDTKFFKNSLVNYITKHLDEQLGFSYDINFSFKLLESHFNEVADGHEYTVYMGLPYKSIFMEDTFDDKGVKIFGMFIPENIVNIIEDNFIENYDKLYLATELATGFNNSNIETQSINSNTPKIVIPIIYELNGNKELIGSYEIYNNDNIKIIKITFKITEVNSLSINDLYNKKIILRSKTGDINFARNSFTRLNSIRFNK